VSKSGKYKKRATVGKINSQHAKLPKTRLGCSTFYHITPSYKLNANGVGYFLFKK